LTEVRAVLFDVDGTLVDSNYLHVDAWHRSFADIGRPVDAWRIHRDIGMDSGGLLQDLLGDDVDEFGDRAKEGHSERYSAMTDRLRPLPGARELIAALRERGLAVVLATSAPGEELEVLMRVLGLDEGDVPTTNADDVDEAKPHPGIVQVALERAGVSADEAVFVGDSVWDMVAAQRAGVSGLGVRSGGFGADELSAAGAGEVVDDVAELLARGSAWPA
jgi:HAD superfamily hydrolase (TIGR01509 family)